MSDAGPHRGDEAQRLQFQQNVQQWQELLKASTASQVLATPSDQWGAQGVLSLYDMLGGAAAMLAAGIPPAPTVGLAPPSSSVPLLGRPLPTPRTTNRRKTPSRPKAGQPRGQQQGKLLQEEQEHEQQQAEPSSRRADSQSDQQGTATDEEDSAGPGSGRRGLGRASSQRSAGRGANGASRGKAAQGNQNGAESAGDEEALEEEYAGLTAKELKAIRRKQANREAARRSRLRKQAEADMIAAKASELELYKQAKEQEVVSLRAHVEQLNGLVLQLAAHKVQLMDQVRSLGGAVAPDIEAAPAPAPVQLHALGLGTAQIMQQLREGSVPAVPASAAAAGNPAKRSRTDSGPEEATAADGSEGEDAED